MRACSAKLKQRMQTRLRPNGTLLHPHVTIRSPAVIDITYRRILIPSVLSLVSRETADIILDAGCGVGYLTSLLTDHASRVVGVDPSLESIKIARRKYGSQIDFIEATVESYSQHTSEKFDLIVVNMVLMDILNLEDFMKAISYLLRQDGALIFTMTHPWFWPRYYGYADKRWFRYSQELAIEAPFKITAEPDCPLVSTHIHRPLETYIQGFWRAGLSLEILNEPMPSAEVSALYPEPWIYPRDLVGVCRLEKKFRAPEGPRRRVASPSLNNSPPGSGWRGSAAPARA